MEPGTLSLSTAGVIIPPDFSVVKTELFDVDVANWILRHDGIEKDVKVNIKAIMKARKHGNQHTVHYIFGKALKHEMWGRLCATKGIGLQSLKRDVRAALARKYYWDLDFVNCQAVILCQICEKNGLKCDALDMFCKNREAIYETCKLETDLDRKSIKECIIAVLFGAIPHEKPTWVRTIFYPEVNQIMKNMATIYPKQYAHACKVKESNSLSSCCAIVLQTEERQCLMALDTFLTKENRQLDVFIHDGGFVRKLQGETEFPEALMREAEIFVTEATGYSIKLACKPIETTFVMNEAVYPKTEYQRMKEEFEKTHFKVIADSCYYAEDLTGGMTGGRKGIVRFSSNDLAVSYQHLKCEDLVGEGRLVRVSFIHKWTNDEKMRLYASIVMIPTSDASLVPVGAYNLWRGFEIESQPKCTSVEHECILDDLLFLNDHLFRLCGGDQPSYEYVMNWLAFLFQQPVRKNGVAILFKSRQGMGKEMFFRALANMIGERYCGITNQIERDVFGQFNGFMRHKILTVFDELSHDVSFPKSENLKELITCKTDKINDKNCKLQENLSFNHYMFFSNNGIPIKIEATERRTFVCECKEDAPSAEYFNRLVKIVENRKVLRTFYDDLMERDTSNIDWNKDRPATSFYDDLREACLDKETEFIVQFVQQSMYKKSDKISAKDLFIVFQKFLTDEKSKYSTSAVRFGIKLKNLGMLGLQNRHTKTGAVYCFDFIQCYKWLASEKFIRNAISDAELETAESSSCVQDFVIPE